MSAIGSYPSQFVTVWFAGRSPFEQMTGPLSPPFAALTVSAARAADESSPMSCGGQGTSASLKLLRGRVPRPHLTGGHAAISQQYSVAGLAQLRTAVADALSG